MPEKKNRIEGDAQPDADNCVIDCQSQSDATYTVRHRTRLALESGLPKHSRRQSCRHLSGEAWPREHMHVEYERSGTENAGVQVADDQPSSALRCPLPPFSVIIAVGSQSPAAHRDHDVALYENCLLVMLGDLG